jgi:hypothetical protein
MSHQMPKVMDKRRLAPAARKAFKAAPGLALFVAMQLAGVPSVVGSAALAGESSRIAQAPAETCASARAACLQSHVREGAFGSRYVPLGEGAECEAAYQACLNPDGCEVAQRACLRGAARRTSAGVEYVPPEDVSRCLQEFRVCRAAGSGKPETGQKADPKGGASWKVPARLRINLGEVRADCASASGRMQCDSAWALGNSRWSRRFEGRIEGDTAAGTEATIEDVSFASVGCAYRWKWSYQVTYRFEEGGKVHVEASGGTIALVANSCPVPPKSSLPASFSGDTTWQESK